MGITLQKRFQSLHDTIWETFDEAFQSEKDLRPDNVPLDLPERARAINAERIIGGMALRGMASSCKSLAETMEALRDDVEPGSDAYLHFSNVADFAERHVERDLKQFREIQASYLRAVHNEAQPND